MPNDRRISPLGILALPPDRFKAPVVAANKVNDRATNHELVLGTVVEGAARAYPIRMFASRATLRGAVQESADGVMWVPPAE